MRFICFTIISFFALLSTACEKEVFSSEISDTVVKESEVFNSHELRTRMAGLSAEGVGIYVPTEEQTAAFRLTHGSNIEVANYLLYKANESIVPVWEASIVSQNIFYLPLFNASTGKVKELVRIHSEKLQIITTNIALYGADLNGNDFNNLKDYQLVALMMRKIMLEEATVTKVSSIKEESSTDFKSCNWQQNEVTLNVGGISLTWFTAPTWVCDEEPPSGGGGTGGGTPGGNPGGDPTAADVCQAAGCFYSFETGNCVCITVTLTCPSGCSYDSIRDRCNC